MQKLLLTLFLSVCISPLVAQQEGWTTTCTGNFAPRIREILIDACGTENEVSTSEYFIFKNGRNPLNTNDLKLKCTSLNSGLRTAWVQDFTVTNAAVIDSLNWGTGNCPYRPFRAAQVIPPNATVLAFVNQTPDISFLDNRLFENLCHSTVYVVFGVLNTSNQYVGAFRNFGFPNQCSGIACLKQIEVTFGNCIQNMVYHYEHLPQPPAGGVSAAWTNGSYIRPNADGTLYYGGGNNAGICLRTQNLLCSPDTTFLTETTCNPALVGWDTLRKTKMNTCDSIIVRHKTLIPSTIRAQIRMAQPISCAGRSDGILEVAQVSGGKSPFQYQWNSGHVGIRADFLRAGTYQLTVTDSVGCKTNTLFELKQPAPFQLKAIITPETCYDATDAMIEIHAIQGGKPPFAYAFNDANIFTIFKSFPYKLKHITTGNYIFLLKDSLGCVHADTLFVPQPPQRIVVFDTADYHLILGDTLMLNPKINFQPKSIQWTPKTFLDCDTCLYPMAKPLQTIHYQIVTKDSMDCKVAAKVAIGVAKPHKVYFPSVFSPNHDGLNDTFTIYADQEVTEIVVLQVVDRWGNLHFQQTHFQPNNETNSWNGGGLPTGTVLMYQAKVLFKDGAIEIFTGDVTIL